MRAGMRAREVCGYVGRGCAVGAGGACADCACADGACEVCGYVGDEDGARAGNEDGGCGDIHSTHIATESHILCCWTV